MFNFGQALKKMKKSGQEHVLKYFDELNLVEKSCLLAQIELCDISLIEKAQAVKRVPSSDAITPINVYNHENILNHYDKYKKIGVESIKNGRVATVLLAGGQGTRLGVKYSKGMVDIGVDSSLFIFECLFNNTMEVVNEAGCWIPFYIMTSENNHGEIVNFLNDNDFFGYNSNYVHFFVQEMLPSVDFNYKYLMSSKSSLSFSPSGNGCWFHSMEKAGLVEGLKSQGVEWINVFPVDNVLQKIADPVFIGATICDRFSCGAKVVKKITPTEKIGTICNHNSRPSVIEYYEATNEIIESKDYNGELLYNYGVIFNYLFELKQLGKILSKKLPIHLAKKKIKTINAHGNAFFPEKENGYKFETLTLDLIEIIGDCLPFEVLREREFAPIKNREGVDSIESARELLLKNNAFNEPSFRSRKDFVFF